MGKCGKNGETNGKPTCDKTAKNVLSRSTSDCLLALMCQKCVPKMQKKCSADFEQLLLMIVY